MYNSLLEQHQYKHDDLFHLLLDLVKQKMMDKHIYNDNLQIHHHRKQMMMMKISPILKELST
jgi:hypothetical protein